MARKQIELTSKEAAMNREAIRIIDEGQDKNLDKYEFIQGPTKSCPVCGCEASHHCPGHKCDPSTVEAWTEHKTTGNPYLPFDFENLVLAGGGAKTVAYCGVAMVLEKYHILQGIRRFAGASAGAMVAAMLAIGFTSIDVQLIMSVNWKRLSRSTNKVNAYINMFRKLGKYSTEDFFQFLSDVILLKTRNKDITFYQVYQDFGKELCIMVTNANTMTEEYCHVKTTPDMPIRNAIRMSMTYPVEYKPVKITSAEASIYVDGGLMRNYPINCFDGWWLQMDQPLLLSTTDIYDDPFESRELNLKTLGCLVYSGDEYHAFRYEIEQNCLVDIKIKDKVPDAPYAPDEPAVPDTKLGKSFARNWKKRDPVGIQTFIEQLREAERGFSEFIGTKETFSYEELEQMFERSFEMQNKNLRYIEMLFGKYANAKTIYRAIPETYMYNEVTKLLLQKLAESARNSIIKKLVILRHKRQEIRNFSDFVKTIILGLNREVMKVYFRKRDVARTVGINTHYIGTLDLKMKDRDKAFLIEQGKLSTEKFLERILVIQGKDLKQSPTSDPAPSEHKEQILAIIRRHRI